MQVVAGLSGGAGAGARRLVEFTSEVFESMRRKDQRVGVRLCARVDADGSASRSSRLAGRLRTG